MLTKCQYAGYFIFGDIDNYKILNYDEKTGKALKKDYLTYNVDFHGKDLLGNDMPIRGHIEGISINCFFIGE